MWVPVCASIGIFLSWTLLARRLRRYSVAANNAVTIPEFLETRFGDTTGTLRAVSGIITIVFVVFYVSSGLVGGSKLLEQIFGLDIIAGVILTLLAIATYTLIGGFMAVSRTDVSQALLMLGSLVVLVVTLLFETVHPFGHGAGAGFFDPFTLADGSPITLSFVLSVSGWAIGGLGAHRILQRFMAIEHEDKVRQGRNIAVVWVVAVYALAFVVGMVARPALFEAGMLGAVCRYGASLFCGHRGLLPLRGAGGAVDSGDRGGDEHGGLAASVGGGDCDGGRPCAQSSRKGAGHERTGVGGARSAGGHRRRFCGVLGLVLGLHLQPGQLCVGRDGGRVRTGHDSRAVLAPLQRGGARERRW